MTTGCGCENSIQVVLVVVVVVVVVVVMTIRNFWVTVLCYKNYRCESVDRLFLYKKLRNYLCRLFECLRVEIETLLE